jgi:hypothetical protein
MYITQMLASLYAILLQGVRLKRRFWVTLSAVLLACVVLSISAMFLLWGYREKVASTLNWKDRMLELAVSRAVQHKVRPDNAEIAVGREASYHWTSGKGYRHQDIDNDPSHESCFPALRAAKTIMYWERPVVSNNQMVIGIAWDKDGIAHLFYGILDSD